jgi:hypothetical protein
MATTQYHTYQNGSKTRLAGRELAISDQARKLVIRTGNQPPTRVTPDTLTMENLIPEKVADPGPQRQQRRGFCRTT